MNAVMSLCHFCESHGPRVVFTTQPFFGLPPASPCGEPSTPAVPLPSPDGRSKKLFYGDYAVIQSGISALEEEMEAGGAQWETCAACSSVADPTRPAFLTNDHQTQASYLSSQYPFHPEVLEILRNSCLRSLSCEVCPDGEGPVFFGDDQHGHTLSYSFTLRDSKARGFQHWYSIVIVSMDKMLLLNFYDLLVESLHQAVGRIQKAANQVFESEQREVGKAGGLQLSAAPRAGMLPSGFLRQRTGSAAASRALAALTADADVFRGLHRTFAWILNRQLPLTEAELAGQPSQDELCRLEEEEGQAWAHGLAPAPDDTAVRRPPFFGPGASGRVDKAADFQPYADLQGIQAALRSNDFLRLAHSTVIGDQVVVRSSSRNVTMRLLDAISTLLPYGCTRMIYHSPKYQPSWVCNLLGLQPTAEIPADIRAARTMVELIVSDDGSSSEDDRTTVQDMEMADSTTVYAPFSGLTFELRASPTPTRQDPKILGRIRTLVCEAELRPDVLAQILMTVKTEWQSKTKQIFQFTRQHPDLRGDKLKKLMAVLGVGPADEAVVAFWQGGLSKEYRASVLSSAANASSKKSSDASNHSGLSE